MKAKEFLNKIMRGDKTTIKNNTGIIGFDEKGNNIKEGGGDNYHIYTPEELEEMTGGETTANPTIEEDEDATGITFAFVASTSEDAEVVTYLDGEPSASIRSDKFLIDEEYVELLPLLAPYLGWYNITIQGTLEPALTTGEHTLGVEFDGTMVSVTFTVE